MRLNEETIDQPGLLPKPLVIESYYAEQDELQMFYLGTSAALDPSIRWRETDEESWHYHEKHPAFWRAWCQAIATVRLRRAKSLWLPYFSVVAGAPWIARFYEYLKSEIKGLEIHADAACTLTESSLSRLPLTVNSGRPRDGVHRVVVSRSLGGNARPSGWMLTGDSFAAQKIAAVLWASDEELKVYHLQGSVGFMSDVREILHWVDPRIERDDLKAHLLKLGVTV